MNRPCKEFMSEENQHRMKVSVVGEEIAFRVNASEEEGFRWAADYVNNMWNRYQAGQPGKSSHYILAKVALAFAEVIYHQTVQLKEQAELIDQFEKDLDQVLLRIE